MRVGFADEAITQIAAASHQHERRAIDDGLQFRFAGAQRLFGPLAFGQFLKAADRSFNPAGGVLERLHTHQHRDARAVGPFDNEFGADNALAAAHGAPDRRGVEVKRLAIGPIAPERAPYCWLGSPSEARGPIARPRACYSGQGRYRPCTRKSPSEWRPARFGQCRKDVEAADIAPASVPDRSSPFPPNRRNACPPRKFLRLQPLSWIGRSC